jgi:hypothetical protein
MGEHLALAPGELLERAGPPPRHEAGGDDLIRRGQAVGREVAAHVALAPRSADMPRRSESALCDGRMSRR